MARLIYFTQTSVDGFIADESGDYAWSTPTEEVFAFITELVRPIGMYLYGRKTYQTMAVWQTPEVLPAGTLPFEEFARIWQTADKVVYSRTLTAVSTPKTRLYQEFDAEAVGEWKRQRPHDVLIGGPTLAAEAIQAGLVDEIQLLVVPATLGSGRRVLLSRMRTKLDLLDERRFSSGEIFLRYKIRG